jgi:hypothetical protein
VLKEQPGGRLLLVEKGGEVSGVGFLVNTVVF